MTIRHQIGPQRAFAQSKADITIYGGAAGGGKTFALVAEPIYHAGNAGFSALILRRTYPEIFQPGGPWVEAERLYGGLRAEPIMSPPRGPAWRFATGSLVKFDHLQHENDKYKYQGGQIPLICFDQLEHFSESQFWYLLSRNRSLCGVKPYIRATCNPQPGWLADLLEWWIDPITGYPIEERGGRQRWFVRVGDQIHWADSRRYLEQQFDGTVVMPKSFTFIPAKLEDNAILMQRDPGYQANLMAMPAVQRERLLNGNWQILDLDGTEWPPDYFNDIFVSEAEWPDSFERYVMSLDGSKGRTAKADYSAIVGVGLNGGKLWVDASIDRRPAERILSDGCDMAQECWPEAFGIEENGFQDLYAPLFQSAMEGRRMPPLPIELINNKVKKETRIRRLGPYLKQGLLRVRRTTGGARLVEQMRGFPLKDVHDDGPDALEMALRVLVKSCQSGYNADDETIYAEV